MGFSLHSYKVQEWVYPSHRGSGPVESKRRTRTALSSVQLPASNPQTLNPVKRCCGVAIRSFPEGSLRNSVEVCNFVTAVRNGVEDFIRVYGSGVRF